MTNRNQNIYQTVLVGERLEDNQIPEETSDTGNHPFVVFADQHTRKRMGLSTKDLSKSVCLVGDPGNGKTNCMLMLTSSLRPVLENEGANLIIFDAKGDYYREFSRMIPRERVIVVGPGREYRSVTAYHNLFAEMMERDQAGRLIYEGEISDQFAAEIAAMLFEDLDSITQPIFPSMGKEIVHGLFCAFMRAYAGLRDGRNPNENQGMLNNLKLLQYIQEVTVEELRMLFHSERMRDFRGVLSYIESNSPQTQGVLSYVRSALTSSFTGVFAKADPEREFSMRNIVTQCTGRIVFIEYDLSAEGHLSNYFGLMIDLALKHALGSHLLKRSDNYFLLDEFPLLPELRYLSKAISFGRGLHVKVIAAFQNVNQLYSRYGEHEACSMLGGFQSLFAFGSLDPETRRYISERFAENYLNCSFQPLSAAEPVNIQRTGHTVEDSDLLYLEPGEAVISLSGGRPFVFKFSLYKRS